MPSQSCKGASWEWTGQPGLSTLLVECPLPLANSGVSIGQRAPWCIQAGHPQGKARFYSSHPPGSKGRANGRAQCSVTEERNNDDCYSS